MSSNNSKTPAKTPVSSRKQKYRASKKKMRDFLDSPMELIVTKKEGVTKKSEVIDRSEELKDFESLAFGLKQIKTPKLKKAGDLDLKKILVKPTVQDMNLFDQQEQNFLNKLEILYQLSAENYLPSVKFEERVEFLASSFGAEEN
jgi:hypothetical protein